MHTYRNFSLSIPELDEARKRLNLANPTERQKYMWLAEGLIWGVRVPEGVNPKRLKKFRRRTARAKTAQARLFREVKRGPDIPDPEVLGEQPDDALKWSRAGWRLKEKYFNRPKKL